MKWRLLKPKFWKKRKKEVNWLILLNHDARSLFSIFEITEKRLDEMIGYIADLLRSDERISVTLQNIANTEFFSDKERILALYIAGKMTSNPLQGFLGMILGQQQK